MITRNLPARTWRLASLLAALAVLLSIPVDRVTTTVRPAPAPAHAQSTATADARPSDPVVGPGGAPPAGHGTVHTFQYVRPLDGDTFETQIEGQQVVVGLAGVKVPEANTACGKQAATALLSIGKKGMRLDEDRSGAFDARKRRIYMASTLDLRPVAEELVRRGVASVTGRGGDVKSLRTAEAVAKTLHAGCLWGDGQPAPDTTGALVSQATKGGVIAAAAPPEASAAAAPATAPVAVFGITGPSAAASVPAGFVQETISGGLVTPTRFEPLPDGRILIAQKNGVVRVIKGGTLLATPLIDLSAEVNNYGDHGLIGMAADPQFATNGYVYLLYTYENDPTWYSGPKTGRLTRVTAVGDAAAPASEVAILGTVVGSSCQNFAPGADCLPADDISHSAGNIKFAPDGTMFITQGDGSSYNLVDDLALRAQSLDSLAGKVIHITTGGLGVPANPFWNSDPTANRSKVWAYGMRNPFRLAIKPGTSLPYLGDVGWNTWESLDVVRAGANLGWPCYEGAAIQSGYAAKPQCQALYNAGTRTAPMLTYDHCQLFCGSTAVVAGAFNSGTVLPAQYQGAFFYGDYGQGFIRYVKTDANDNLLGSWSSFATGVDSPVQIEFGPDGQLWYLAINAGELRRIRYTAGATPPTAVAGATPNSGLAPLNVQFSSAGSSTPNGTALGYSWNFADGTPASTAANPTHNYSSNGTYSAVLTVTDGVGPPATATAKVVVGSTAPVVTISSPASTLLYKVGDIINFAGSASDRQDGTIPASGLSWQVLMHHCPGGVCHIHYFATAAGPSGTFTVPDHGDDTYFELQLTATDSVGLATTQSVNIHPQTVQLTVNTAPSALTPAPRVVYDDLSSATPFTKTTVVGSTHTLYFPSPQGGAVFTSWSDGGAQSHNVTVPATNTTVTANYRAAATSATFDGTSAYAQSGADAKLNLTGDWTVEAWMKDETAGGYNHPLTTLLTKGDDTQSERPFFLAVSGGSLIAGSRALGATYSLSYDLIGNHVTPGAWHHVAATLQASNLQLSLYLDGALVVQGTVGGHSTAGNSLPVSLARTGSGSGYWTGKLDDVRLWNVVRSGAQVSAYRANELTSPPAGLVAAWKLDEGSGNTAGDMAAAPSNLTLSGASGWSLDVGAQPPLSGAGPNLTNVQAVNVTSSGATITWSSDSASDSQVDFGTTTAYGGSTPLDTTFVTAHSQLITGAAASTQYHFRVKSRDTAGTLATSGDYTFTTAASAPCPCNIWPGTAVPTTPASSDGSSVEVGVKFRSDLNGYVNGVRFYKGATNTGTHIGNLWSASGTRLASAVFANETASGWQQVLFASPVAVTANTTYVVSYHADTGHYASDPGFLTSAVNTPPLHALADKFDGGNGVFVYGASSFPTQTYQASNYWVDVVFNTAFVDKVPPSVTSQSPSPGATGTSVSAPVTATFSKPVSASSIGFTLNDANNKAVLGTISYASTTNTVSFQPSAVLASGVRYTATVSGAVDQSGNQMSGPATWSFTTVSCPCSIWPGTAAPANPSTGDSSAVEVGVKFRSDANGYVNGVRFFKGSSNTGVHVGNLWTSTGTLLASATFSAETASGWQQVTFASPVAVNANTTYVASYHTNVGHYASDQQYFGVAVDSYPLHALADGFDGPNGLFAYGSGGFPNQAYQANNYWVDVVFNTAFVDTVPPTVSAQSPAPGSARAGVSQPVTATFSKSVSAGSIGFTLKTSAGAAVPATVAYTDSNHTATLTPTTALTAGATYTATVSGATDLSGNVMTSPVTWSFTTVACPCSVWPASAAPANPASGDSSAVEVGVKFRSDAGGYINGIRFYKGAGNTGIHVGNLWSSTGTLLASATFSAETASGWQQVSFASPVAVNANTTYVASYHTNVGHYASDQQYFGLAVDSYPLHALADGFDGPNGVYGYGPGGFPTQTYLASNYWVDVVFNTTLVDTTPPTVTSTNPAAGATAVATGSAVAATFSKSVSAASIAFTLKTSAGAAVPATVTYADATRTATLTPSTALNSGATYTATISGATDLSGNVMSAPVSWSFTTVPAGAGPAISAVVAGSVTTTAATISWTTDTASSSQVDYGTTTAYGSQTALDNTPVTAHSQVVSGLSPATLYHFRVRSADSAGRLSISNDATFTTLAPSYNCPCTVWPATATPALAAKPDDSAAVEVGFKFRTDVSGYISGVRFYKGTGNTGTHVGNLWSSTGALLATATFGSETATGWQQVNFATAVAVSANTTYVASYHTNTGHYAYDSPYFGAAVNNAPLHGLADGADGGNGVYVYGAGGFPNQSFQASNYWIDVVFNTVVSDKTPPTVTANTPAAGASGVVPGVVPTATFSKSVTSTSIVFGLAGPGGTAVTGATAYDDASRTARFTPAAPLAYSTTYTATVSGATDLSGNVMSAPVSWSFNTAAAPSCPCSVWGASAVPGTVANADANAIEVGMKFRSDVAGTATGVRFYKGSGNTGTHVGNLWSSTGTLLATVTFSAESATGWQQALFSTPAAIQANTTYVVSYHTDAGHYSSDAGYFTGKGVDAYPLHALADGVDGADGVYRYGATGFPNQTFQGSNYWVDVVFKA